MSSGRVVLFVILILFAVPGFAGAINTQADAQCPSGGVVGQTCKDSTNGFQTTGHCTHIGECRADKWFSIPKGCDFTQPKVPPECLGGKPTTGGVPTTQTPRPTVMPTPTPSPFPSTDISSGILYSDIFNQAFSDETDFSLQDMAPVSTTSINGIEYYLSGGETLEAGALLTESPVEAPTTQRNIIAMGSIFDLRPIIDSVTEEKRITSADTYTPAIGTFTSNGSIRYENQLDLAGRARKLGDDVLAILGSLLGGSETKNSGNYSDGKYYDLYAQVKNPLLVSGTTGFNQNIHETAEAGPLRYMLGGFVVAIKTLGISIANFVSTNLLKN